MKIYLVLTFVVGFCIFDDGDSQVYSSILRLTALAEIDNKLFLEFEKFLTEARNRSICIPPDVIRIYQDRRKDVQCLTGDMDHPIRAFYLVSNALEVWNKVTSILRANKTLASVPEVRNFINVRYGYMDTLGFWPTKDDVNGTMDNILRIWTIYDLDIDDILNGVILAEATRPMKIQEIENMADFAGDDNLYYYQMILLQKIIDMVDEKIEKERLKEKLKTAYCKSKLRKVPIVYISTLLYTGFTSHQRRQNALRRARLFGPQSIGDIEEAYEEPNDFKKLCRGPLKNATEQSKLKCFLRETKVPFMFAKEEVVNYVPRVSLFHDVISQTDINYIKSEASKKFKRSEIADGFSRKRIGQTAFLRDFGYPKLSKRLNRRISSIVGLSTQAKPRASHVEDAKVTSYASGGYFHIHKDSSDLPLWELTEETQRIMYGRFQFSGDRIATWMFYISDVRAGGTTVFPLLKARVPVVKGAAAFWYNYKPSGEEDRRVYHGGCPVILGSKWICNKWIRQSGQVLKRLCRTDEESEEFYPDRYLA